MHLNSTPPEQQVQGASPGAGHHLLDVSMYWGAGSGVRRVLTARHERLRALGWRHTVIAPGAQGPGLVDCGGLPLPGGDGSRWVLGRGRALRQMEFIAPDLIESADPHVLAWASLAAAEQLRVPAVAFCHDDLSARMARLGRGAERWSQRYLAGLYRHFDLVMAPSSGMAQRLQAWGVPRVTVQPLGVDCAVFTPCARDAAWRAQFCRDQGLAPDARLLICSGRFTARRQLQMLADAVALLGRGHVLLAVGDGPAPPVGDQVRVLPPERDNAQRARLLASCDAYVDAGGSQSAGLDLLEAMACGTPVIVASELAELAFEAGLVVDRPRAGSWAEAMDASLGSINASQRRNALARAQAQDWPHVLAQMTRRYTELLGRPALPTAAAASRGPALQPWAGSLARQR